MDPDSSRARRSRPAERRRPVGAGLPVTVSDGQGRPVRDGGLGRWLAGVMPARSRGEVAIALVTDRHIQKLNHQYRGKAAPTDVLSFVADDFGLKPEAAMSDAAVTTPAAVASAFRGKDRGPRFLGDIVIATGVARRQAREAGHSYATELRVLALHGLLHLLGYDHDRPGDRGRMRRAEARLRRAGGLREGLIARSAKR